MKLTTLINYDLIRYRIKLFEQNQPPYRSSIDSQPNGKKIGIVVTVTHKIRTVRKIGKDDLRLIQC